MTNSKEKNNLSYSKNNFQKLANTDYNPNSLKDQTCSGPAFHECLHFSWWGLVHGELHNIWATEDHTIWASNHDLRWNLLVDFAAKFAGGFVQVFMKEGPRTWIILLKGESWRCAARSPGPCNVRELKMLKTVTWCDMCHHNEILDESPDVEMLAIRGIIPKWPYLKITCRLVNY